MYMTSGERPGGTLSATSVPSDRSSRKETTVFIDPVFVEMLLVLRAAYDKTPDGTPPPTTETEIAATLDRVKDRCGATRKREGFRYPEPSPSEGNETQCDHLD